MTDLLYSDIEDELRTSVRALLDDKSPWTTVLAAVESDRPYDEGLWRLLAGDLGCAGLAVPEEAGGAGASHREVAVVMEELGRSVAPVPFLGSAVLATTALLAAGAHDSVAGLAAGERTACLLVSFATAPGAAFPATVSVDEDEDEDGSGSGDGSGGGRLSGTVTSVADALTADLLVVPADGALYVVDAAAEGVRVTPVTSLDMTRPLCDVVLSSAAATRVATGGTARDALESAVAAGAALLASEQLGLAERCLEMTVEYVKTRYQFGRQIGSYQGLKHRLADLWVSITQARAVARYAADCLARSDADTAIAVAVAQAHCSAVAVKAAEECVQMHGGIGFTWEHPAHLYLKRAKSTAIALGSADRHRAALAGLVDLPA